MSSHPKLKLDWCSHEAAKYAVEHWHYSKRMPKSKLVRIGVWENDEFIGCILFGVGATGDLVKQYGLDKIQGCELVRIALAKHYSPVTKIVKFALKMLQQYCPGLRLVVSFADPAHGHLGKIYQGGNWYYSGVTSINDEYILNNRRYQGRSFRNSYKGMEHHPLVQIVKGSSKYRYLMPLDRNMRKQIETLKQPYPK